jgi:pyruvate formate lyase activating enzyme
MRAMQRGRLRHFAGTARRGLVGWYRDPLPTNCVADFFCEGHRQGGKHNLAVFYRACTLNCLFCQNWTFRGATVEDRRACHSADELADAANQDTHCVCFFGGDPSAQLPHALAAARRLHRRGVAICFETNGMGRPALMELAARLVLDSGGVIKVDLKAWDPTLHLALTGADNGPIRSTFSRLARILLREGHPPGLCAATLLVPGYVDAEEVDGIARFIASIDRRIPYSLLAFHPQFQLTDLPTTSFSQAEAALRAAHEAGLHQVRIGNIHLLSR